MNSVVGGVIACLNARIRKMQAVSALSHFYLRSVSAVPERREARAARRQLKGFGTIISFDVRGDAPAADAVCAGLQLIQHATSLGAVESTIERRASIPGQEHLPPALLRLSVGIESVEDLWTDLDRALRNMPGV